MMELLQFGVENDQYFESIKSYVHRTKHVLCSEKEKSIS
jgi:hypothetical protein